MPSNHLPIRSTDIFEGQLARLGRAERIRADDAIGELAYAISESSDIGEPVDVGYALPIDIFGQEYLVYWTVDDTAIEFYAIAKVRR